MENTKWLIGAGRIADALVGVLLGAAIGPLVGLGLAPEEARALVAGVAKLYGLLWNSLGLVL